MALYRVEVNSPYGTSPAPEYGEETSPSSDYTSMALNHVDGTNPVTTSPSATPAATPEVSNEVGLETGLELSELTAITDETEKSGRGGRDEVDGRISRSDSAVEVCLPDQPVRGVYESYSSVLPMPYDPSKFPHG